MAPVFLNPCNPMCPRRKAPMNGHASGKKSRTNSDESRSIIRLLPAFKLT